MDEAWRRRLTTPNPVESSLNTEQACSLCSLYCVLVYKFLISFRLVIVQDQM